MASTTGPARAASLSIERLTETVIIDGETVDLPRREFALLAALAARPGEAIHTRKLVGAIWPDTPGMTAQDVYVVMSHLRKRLGEAERKHKLIQNKPRFGYYLDLPAESVVIADDLDQLSSEGVIHLDPQAEESSEGPTADTDHLQAAPAPELTPAAPRRRTLVRSAMALGFAALAIAGSWSAGYLISSQRSQSPDEMPEVSADVATDGPEESDPTASGRKEPEKQGRESARSHRKDRSRAPSSSDGSEAVVAAPPVIQAPAATSSSAPASQSAPQQPAKAPKPQPEPLPPAPTRFLYHLVNQESGDHFVTTDGNVASQYQARGYEGGAIGRIYTSAIEGTRAISTNQGTAYIFISSAPKTEPASRAVALWYSTNNSGDFFYTTSQAEATQSGWKAQVVGYVGGL